MTAEQKKALAAADDSDLKEGLQTPNGALLYAGIYAGAG